MKAETFVIKKEDDTELYLVARIPSSVDQREASKVYNRTFTDAIKAQCIVRAKMEDVLKEQGLWDDKKQKELNDLQNQIFNREKALAKGGIKLKDAKDIALEMKKIRDQVRELISVKTSLDVNTAEGQADNARFNYLVSTCVVYKDNEEKRYFDNLDDYLARIDDPAALRGAQVLANMIYGLDDTYEKNLPENKFLIKYKFVDDNLRFINNDGKLVDRDGRLVDENGRYINEKGEFVDKDGNRIDEQGEYLVDHQPFLDDEGNPIIEPSEERKDPIQTATETEPVSE
jgi:hypothetical protein